MSTKKAEIENAKEFLRAALQDGPRKVAYVIRESYIYNIPTWAIVKAIKEIGASRWITKDGLMWGFGAKNYR